MPELPEVERAAKLLDRAARGRTIRRIVALHPAQRRGLPARRAARAAGRTIVRIERRAKHQLVHLGDGAVLHVHFRMAGDWSIGRISDPLPAHARAVIELDDETRIALVDPRALSTMTLSFDGALRLPPLGPEPLDDGFDAVVLCAALARRRGGIKPALLDQRVVAGIGNIYAAESLWYARMDPRTRASSLGLRRCARLVESIRNVVQEALLEPARYSDPDVRTGFAVYDREGEPCHRCGARIRRIDQAGRSTYFCPRCQR